MIRINFSIKRSLNSKLLNFFFYSFIIICEVVFFYDLIKNSDFITNYDLRKKCDLEIFCDFTTNYNFILKQ